jgi:DNA-binding IclR family transcriptional regulator
MKKNLDTRLEDNPTPKGVQSILRTITLLRVIARHDNGVSMSEIAKEVGLHVATTHRILSVLVSEGLVDYNPSSKGYFIGFGLYDLGNNAYQLITRDKLLPVLELISAKTEDTVFLTARSGNKSFCLDIIEGNFPIRTVTINIGTYRPLGLSTGSLALIFPLSQDKLEVILKANELFYSQYNNIKADDIRHLCENSRKAGYVVSQGMFTEGVTSIGMPVYDDQENVIAAISVAAINQRMTAARRKEVVEIMKEAIINYSLHPS